jgi:hypothetical protein
VITFDAVAGKRYNGKVTQVGQVGTTTSGVVYYDVTAQMTDADQQVKSGMTASVTITVSKTDNVLLVPSRSIRTVGQRSMVYKPGATSKDAATPVFVQTGASSGVQTIITSGLKTGDVILANPPALTTTTTATNRGIFGIFGGGGGAPAGGAARPAGGNTGGTTGGNTGTGTGTGGTRTGSGGTTGGAGGTTGGGSNGN